MTETNASGALKVGKPFTVSKTFSLPWRVSTSVLLAYLLYVNSSPGKDIHKLRVLSALLITMAEAEISIVSPCVYFGWVCKDRY